MDQYISRKKELFDNNVLHLADDLINETKKNCKTYKDLEVELKNIRNRFVVGNHWNRSVESGYICVIDKALHLLDKEIGAITISKGTEK